MGQRASEAGRKVLALFILLLAAWLLINLVAGFLATIVWVVVAVVALVAVVWAVRVL